jgi:hypothetical protein
MCTGSPHARKEAPTNRLISWVLILRFKPQGHSVAVHGVIPVRDATMRSFAITPWALLSAAQRTGAPYFAPNSVYMPLM